MNFEAELKRIAASIKTCVGIAGNDDLLFVRRELWKALAAIDAARELVPTTDEPCMDYAEEGKANTARDCRLVTVCASCLQASCWRDKFLCDKAWTAGTLDLPVYELVRLNREHPSYWEPRTSPPQGEEQAT